MEITCSRCHQAIPADGLYCPSCGLPQLTYQGEEVPAPAHSGQLEDVLEQVSVVEWRPALRSALLLAVPAGLLFGGVFLLGLLGLIWIAAAAAWAVTIYVRGQRSVRRSFRLTTGAGARIGLVTGIIAGWIAFAATGVSLYAERYLFHQGKDFDDIVQSQAATMLNQAQSLNANQDTQAAAAFFKSLAAWFLTPEGRAGSVLGGLLFVEFLLVLFAVAGGAVGARMLSGTAKAASRN